jgi:hypothetical protein
MTLYTFNAMNQEHQAEMLWERGVYLMNRQEREHKFALYQLDGFYVEVWYHTPGNEITKLRSFSSTDALAPYLEEITLPGIL